MFISSSGERVLKDTLRRWVLKILLDAGVKDSAGSCRSASTSAACERNHSIDDIMNSAGWSSESTFRRFYHRKVMSAVSPPNVMV